MIKKYQKGLSLIELLVVIVIFVALGILATRSVLTTLRGSRKSEATVKLRENINFAVSVMERQIRDANTVYPCPNPDALKIDYYDREGMISSFSCKNDGTIGYIASGSARLTTSDVDVTSCSIACTPGSGTSTSYVDIAISAKDATYSGAEGAVFTTNTRVTLRNY